MWNQKSWGGLKRSLIQERKTEFQIRAFKLKLCFSLDVYLVSAFVDIGVSTDQANHNVERSCLAAQFFHLFPLNMSMPPASSHRQESSPWGGVSSHPKACETPAFPWDECCGSSSLIENPQKNGMI